MWQALACEMRVFRNSASVRQYGKAAGTACGAALFTQCLAWYCNTGSIHDAMGQPYSQQ